MDTRTMTLSAPIDRWDEAVPLGNGLIGALLWGRDGLIRLSLDRGDLWDLRETPQFQHEEWNWRTIQDLVRKGDSERLRELFEKPYRDNPFPTKIPAGRIELDLPAGNPARSFHLDMRRATGSVRLDVGRIETFVSATAKVGLIRVHGSRPGVRISSPFEHARQSRSARESFCQSPDRLGYPQAERGCEADVRWLRQRCAGEFTFAVVVGWRQCGEATELAFTVSTTKDAPDPVALGCRLVREALERGYDGMFAPHAKWWDEFWRQSSVELPDAAIERHYNLVQYFYGSASRPGAPPIALQGVWTADEDSLPPWKGDYHNDLNTQLTYWAYLAANHLEEGLCFLDFLWDLLPTFRKFASEFYSTGGAGVPGVMSLDGKAMGGWVQYSCSPTNGAWLGHAFYLHWRYTMDGDFLSERAYPFCRAIAECLDGLLEPAEDGRLKLPLSSSPEIHDNSLAAWLESNSHYDLALMRWLYGALVEMANELGEHRDAEHWQDVLEHLDDLSVRDESLMLAPGEMLKESHRHHAHLMAIHPLGILNIDGSERDRSVIDNSLRHMDHLGMQSWVGYSFSWMACISARAGQADRALNMLELYLKGFVSRNGFHLNGDYKRLGLSGYSYRPFTLEGNFAAAQAVHEMLIQSWGGGVRVFPAVPHDWAEVSFTDLRAEGAFSVSARRRNGRTEWVRICAGRPGLLRLRDPFEEHDAHWNTTAIERRGNDYVITLEEGDVLEGRRSESIKEHALEVKNLDV